METSIKGNNGTAKGTFELQDWIQAGGISYHLIINATPKLEYSSSIGCFGYLCIGSSF